MDERELTFLVKTDAGFQTFAEARLAIRAAVGALACALDDEDAHALELAVPGHVARLLRRPSSTLVRTAHGLYVEAERRERVGLGFAIEHVQVVCRVLARRLDPDLIARMRRRLPPDIAGLFGEPPPAEEAPPHVHTHPTPVIRPPQTLARARPGSSEPIAETRHVLAHRGSVARSPAPHAERMVETARSTRPTREDETLATARTGPGRP
jgi:uncharacterized protein (DUF2267 family)